MKNLFIDILAFGALLSSVLVITSKNPVIAVIFLISVFVNAAGDRKSTRLNSSHSGESRMPSSA